MELTEVQKALIALLKMSGEDEDSIIGTLLLLGKSEKAQEDLFLWLHQFNPEKKPMSPEQRAKITEEALRIHRSLQNGLQTAERM